MKPILFATANKNKAKEIQEFLDGTFSLLTLKDINLTENIPETSATIEGNAKQKADYITEHFELDCFADDRFVIFHRYNQGEYMTRIY